jgi:hypothetical protein
MTHISSFAIPRMMQMIKHFKIHDGYVNTDFGNTVLDQLRPELSVLNPKHNLAERFVRFIESKFLTPEVLIDENLKSYFKTLGLTSVFDLFPDSFENLLDKLTPEPIWVLSASSINRGLIAALISSEPDFEVTDAPLESTDISIGVIPLIPIKQMESFYLTRTQFSFHQQIILALLAAQSLKESSLFKARSFSLIIKNKKYSLLSSNQNHLDHKKASVDSTPHYYLNAEEIKHMCWDSILIEAQLREQLPSIEMPDLTEFRAWAETWLQDPATALQQLNEKPASPFLFQALALHADPGIFAEHADKLVSINHIDIRQPMNMMFNQTIMTRSGLSQETFNRFIAYEPSHVRKICESLPDSYRLKRMHETREAQGSAIEFWRRCEHR